MHSGRRRTARSFATSWSPSPSAARRAARVRREAKPDPEAAVWAESVAALPVEKQVQAVTARLKSLNPGFDGTVEIADETLSLRE